jgi:hypothetical protein
MAYSSTNETFTYPASGADWQTENEANWDKVDNIGRSWKVQKVSDDSWEAPVVDTEYYSPDQSNSFGTGTVYRQYVDKSGFTQGVLTDMITGITGATLLIPVDFKFYNSQSSLWFNVESSSFAGDYLFLKASSTSVIQAYIGSSWGTRFRGWVDYTKGALP